MKKEINKEKVINFIIILVAVLVVCALVFVYLKILKIKRIEKAENVPTASWFEEDLKDLFMTESVRVIDVNDKISERAIVTVAVTEVNGSDKYYHCLYRVKSVMGIGYVWELERYI